MPKVHFALTDPEQLDGEVLQRLEKYGASETFSSPMTLVAVVKTCDTMEQSLGDLDHATDLLTKNAWTGGILEAAFHLKKFKIIRELPLFQQRPSSPDIKPLLCEDISMLESSIEAVALSERPATRSARAEGLPPIVIEQRDAALKLVDDVLQMIEEKEVNFPKISVAAGQIAMLLNEIAKFLQAKEENDTPRAELKTKVSSEAMRRSTRRRY